MADEKLIFPIGFDLEEGVRQVQKDWKKHQPEIQKTIDRNPLKLKLELSAKGFNISELKKYIGLSKEIAKANREIAKTRSANALAAQRESRQRVQEATELDQIKQKKAQAALTEERLTQAKQRSANATDRQNAAYKTQGGYLSRLFQRMVAYASVAQAFSFVRNVRDVTAEFELQRVALGSIIGDLNEANAMFEQIKAAAVKSPFQIKELVTYTKQLAAYKIESDELFETTQRLADISAGLGVGMERLVLAYGQIRATGYLRASEVRQLTEAGIPIVEELAKKMSQLRGETVSAAEVMGMISERAISFGMVKEVFDDMTSAGGMFYKMQEKQAETLAGQWSNLQDAISIMYEEIGNTEGVNNSIKGTIGLVKSLAENWRDVYSIVQSLSVAMGVYYVAMKNAAVASKALSVAEATRLSTLKATTIYMPKFLASTKLAITLTRAYRVAVIKSATATGLLSKAFWGLTKAMLSNPYTAVLAALAGITVAIVKFSNKTKTAQERIEDLNKSVASLTNLKNNVKPLVDELDALSQKSNKTVEEQKRLNQVTQELARIYPEAINGIREFGNEAKVSAAKVAMLYGAEAKALQEGIKINLQYNQDELKKEQAKLARINKALLDKTYTETTYGFGGAATTTTYTYTTEELKELAKQADESRNKIASLNNSIKEGRIALGLQKSDLEKVVDGFNTWQKELEAVNEGTNDLGDNIRIFDDTTISQITKITDATSRVADEYKRLAKEKERVDKALLSEGAKADSKTYAQLEKRLGRINMALSMLYNFLEKYGGLDLLEEGGNGGGKKTNPRIAQLKDELSTVEKIYKEYQQLSKYGEEYANKTIAQMFQGIDLKYLQMATSPEKMRKGLEDALRMAKLEGDKELALEIQYKLGKFDADEEQRKLEKSLKDLSDKISRTKTAKEFFDRILGMNGDRELSATLTMSVYGTTGDDLKSALVKQVEEAFKGVDGDIDVSDAIDYNTMTINYQKLAEIYAKNQDKILDANKSMAESIVKDGEKTSASQIEQWAKELEAVKTYADKRVDIARQTQQRISEIEASTLPEDEKQRLQEQYRKKEEKDLAKLEYQSFKESPMYVAMFDNLDSASTTMLNNMRAKLMELKEAWGGLDMPTELKEMQSRLNEIDKQLASRNPFKTLANAYKGYQELREQGSRKEAEQDLIDKTEEHAKAVAQLDILTRSATQAQKQYDDAVKKHGKDSAQAKSYEQLVKYANALVDGQTETVNTTEEAVEASQELVNKWKELDDVVGGAWEQADMLTQAIINLGRNLADAFGGFGSEADAEFFDTLMTGFGNLASGITSIGKGIAMGDPIAIINGIGSAISGLAGLFTAGKVRKANKEIERQQDLIDKLEKSHERLEKQIEKTFGSDYLKNYNDRLANLYAQQEAYLKQAEAERSKGKKEDEEKTQGYLDSASDVAEQIADMQKEVSERFLGTDLASAARDFAQSWIDAYKEFGSTTDAMKEKFHDMIQNMVVESIAGKMMQQLLQPVFDAIDEYSKDGELDEREIATIADLGIGLIDTMDESMTSLVERLRAAGYDIRQSTSGLTGISKDIASASEESILGLAAGINTQNFYISQVPPKLDIIIALLQGGGVQVGGGVNMQDLITIQNQHLSHLPNIAQNTAETVARCERAANACERMADQLDRVIKPRGTQATHTVNTSL